MKPNDVRAGSSLGTGESRDVKGKPAQAAKPLVSPRPYAMPKPFRAFVRKLLPLAAGRACPICARRTERVHTPWYYRPLRWMVRGQSGTRYCYRCRVRWFAFGASGRDIEESPVLKVRPRLFERKPANVARFPVPQGKPPEKKLDAIQLLSVLRDALATLEAELTGAKSVPTPKAKDAEDRSIMH